jgi:AraC-like DNA-binding protein
MLEVKVKSMKLQWSIPARYILFVKSISEDKSDHDDRNFIALRELHETIIKIEKKAQQRSARRESTFSLLHGDSLIYVGLETAVQGGNYLWDGLKRRADPAHPFVVFQYTLAGWGMYSDAAGNHKVAPGSAFLAAVPSAHRYFLPPESPSWTYFFLLLSHDYIAQRLAVCQEQTGAVQRFEPHSPLMTRMLAVFEGSRLGGFHDHYAAESTLFDFLLEYERSCYASPEREDLLKAVRQRVLMSPHNLKGVEQLAAERGMSRSNFSHYFSQTTGTSPALFMRHVRLEEAVRRLLHTDQKLEHIARETGFANANHLCKTFRQRYHLSPGEFRRQMR